MKYKCKVEGCNFETNSWQALGGHIAGHSKRRGITKYAQHHLPTSDEIAAALLNAAVDAINKEQSLQEQLSTARSRMAVLTQSLDIARTERDRIIKIHNEQVRTASMQRTELPSTEALMRLAKLR